MNTPSVHKLKHEWVRICSELSSGAVAKALNRIALNFAKLPQNEDHKYNSYRQFLEKSVLRVVLPSYNLKGTGNINLKEILDPLQGRALLLGESKGIQPKDISLVLNSYSKIHHAAQQLGQSPGNRMRDTSRLCRYYVSQILPEATRLVPQMNEQDLSLVLNCTSKLGISDNQLLKSANETLVRHLRQHYRHESLDQGEPAHSDHSNLLSQMTPQGVSLIVNCFAKSEVALDDSVLAFFVHDYLPKNLHRFITQQLVVTIHSLLKLKVPLKDVSAALKHLDLLIARESTQISSKLLSTSLYTFAKYNYMPTETVKTLEVVPSGNKSARYSELELCNMYYGLGKLNLRCMKFVERLNRAARTMLSKLTSQGISTIYFALAKLEFREEHQISKGDAEAHSLQEALLSQFEKMIELNMVKANNLSKEDNGPSKVLPLHLVNTCFSATTSLILEGRRFSNILQHMLWLNTSAKNEKLIVGNDDVNIAMEETREMISKPNVPIAAFVSKDLGTQGVYQLYCICQHIMLYTKDGLYSQRLAVLQLLRQLFNIWDVISRDKPSSFPRQTTKEQGNDWNNSSPLVDADIITSKIQEDVFSVMASMRDCDTRKVYENPNVERLKRFCKESILVSEAQVTPYVIDILIYSV